MEFAWKIKNNFLSTSSKSWNNRGRPKRIQEKFDNKSSNHQSIDKNFSKNEYINICENLSVLHSRSYITDAELEAGCIFNVIAYTAKNAIMPSSCSALAKKSLSRSCDYFVSEKKEKVIKKYIRIKKLLIQENPEIEIIIDKIVVKDTQIKSDPRQDAMRYELSLLKKGLGIIHDYLNESYYHSMIRKNNTRGTR